MKKKCKILLLMLYIGIMFSRIEVFAIDETYEMHRLYNPNSGEHFYTRTHSERDHLVDIGWQYEGIGWYSS